MVSDREILWGCSCAVLWIERVYLFLHLIICYFPQESTPSEFFLRIRQEVITSISFQ